MGSCTGDFLKEESCQEELVHIVDNGDLVEPPSEGHTCPFRNFGLDGHCLCNKGERVAKLETRFEEASTDRIWILHCEPIAFQLKVNSFPLFPLLLISFLQYHIDATTEKVAGEKWISQTMETELAEPFEWDGIPTDSFLVGFSTTLDLDRTLDRQFVFYTTRFSGKV